MAKWHIGVHIMDQNLFMSWCKEEDKWVFIYCLDKNQSSVSREKQTLEVMTFSITLLWWEWIFSKRKSQVLPTTFYDRCCYHPHVRGEGTRCRGINLLKITMLINGSTGTHSRNSRGQVLNTDMILLSQNVTIPRPIK